MGKSPNRERPGLLMLVARLLDRKGTPGRLAPLVGDGYGRESKVGGRASKRLISPTLQHEQTLA
jgi:hypothetical protein